jgi:NAD(P)-dependent dehydrogenase (short-subunit alcohol dehydrogenase family)
MGAHDNKVAIVTGGAQGIGKGVVDVLSSEGAKICIADISEEHGQEVANSINSNGGSAIFVKGNFEKSDVPEKVVNECVDAFGSVDILVNNVGIQPLTSYKNVEETPEEMWDAILNVNLKSYFLMSKYSIPHMRNNNGGSIVNIASVQGLQSMKLVPPYAASKGGVLSLTRQMSLDYAAENIRVTAICPGTFNTPMVTNSVSKDVNLDEALKGFGAVHPVGRIGEPEEIGHAVSFLSSEKALFITGEYLVVDGGMMAQGAWDTGDQG